MWLRQIGNAWSERQYRQIDRYRQRETEKERERERDRQRERGVIFSEVCIDPERCSSVSSIALEGPL